MKSPKNLRSATPRVCATCKTFEHTGDGASRCTRPDGPVFETGDGDYWYATCDRYKIAIVNEF